MSDFRDTMTQEELEELHRIWSSWQCYITDPYRHDYLSDDADPTVEENNNRDNYVDDFIAKYPHLQMFREQITDYMCDW